LHVINGLSKNLLISVMDD